MALTGSLDAPTTDGAPRVQKEPGLMAAWNRRGLLWPVLAGLVIIVGAAARLRVWATDRGLWHDELYVANNLVKHSYLGMAGGLYWNQTAPPGWLIGEKAIYKTLGTSELWLRLPQLIASVVVLVLATVIASRAVGRWAALLATAFVAVCPMHLYYAGELKQYAVESMMALIVLLAVGLWGGRLIAGTVRRRDTVLFALIAVSVMGGSYTALLVLYGAMAGLLFLLVRRGQWRSCWTAVLASGPAVAVGTFQILLARSHGRLADQDAYFEAGFPADRSSLAGYFRWFPHMWNSFVLTPVGWRWSLVVLLLALAGLVAMWIRGHEVWAVAFIGTLVAALGGALIHGMPLAERVAIYLVAPLMILVASGVDGLIRGLRVVVKGGVARRVAVSVGSVVLAIIVAFAALPAVAGTRDEIRDPLTVAPYQHAQGDKELDNGRALMREVRDRLQPGDVVLAYWYTEPLMVWYGSQYGLRTAGYVGITSAGKCPANGLPELLNGARRVFYVHLELLSFHPADFHARVVAELATHGKIVASHVYGPGTIVDTSPSWTLVDLNAGPDDRFRPPAPLDPAIGCVTYDREWI